MADDLAALLGNADRSLKRYILLPQQGIRATLETSSPTVVRFFSIMDSLAAHRGAYEPLPGLPNVELRVIDSIKEQGPKLVEMNHRSLRTLLAQEPGVRIVPLVYYKTASIARPYPQVHLRSARLSVTPKTTLRVVSRKDGAPVTRARVTAFIDFAQGEGEIGWTDDNGVVRLPLYRGPEDVPPFRDPETTFLPPSRGIGTRLERLYIHPTSGFWGLLLEDIEVTSRTVLQLTPLDLSYTDALRHFYTNSPSHMGSGVRVGVLDTGIDRSHADLQVAGGTNTVVGEDPTDFADNGVGHGTHVAGIIAGRGTPPIGVRGVAPGVELRAYRIFAAGKDRADNYAIAKAIEYAVDDGCDVLNLSFTSRVSNEATKYAIEDAHARGCLVIVAAGNEGRQPVGYPAADSPSVAVSAIGRIGTFPEGTTETADVAEPYGTDTKDFVAAFSNIGQEIRLTGPGVGIISTFPGGYAVMDGTSMACPAVTGVAARQLAAHADILGMPRTKERADEMMRVLLQSASSLGFTHEYEGQGLPR